MTTIALFANVTPGTTAATVAGVNTELYRQQSEAQDNAGKDQQTVRLTIDVPAGHQFVIKRPTTPGVPHFRMTSFEDMATVAIGSGSKISFIHAVAPADRKGPEEAKPLASFITGLESAA